MTILQRTVLQSRLLRRYATVFPSIIVKPPPPLSSLHGSASQGPEKTIGESLFDTKCLAALSEQTHQTPLTALIRQYDQSAGTILNGVNLPYESQPTKEKQVSVSDSKDVVLVAHCATNGIEDKVTLSSGFVLNAKWPGKEDECLVLTCAHTLEEIRQSSILTRSTTTIVDEWSGAVVGVMLGAEGGRGRGVPAEAIFEMFELPGFVSRT